MNDGKLPEKSRFSFFRSFSRGKKSMTTSETPPPMQQGDSIGDQISSITIEQEEKPQRPSIDQLSPEEEEGSFKDHSKKPAFSFSLDGVSPIWISIISCFCYSFTSLLTTLTNKALLTTFSFTHSSALLLWQYSITFLLCLLSRKAKLISFKLPSMKLVLHWIPLELLFILMLLSNTFALRFISVPMVTVIKAVSTAFTGILDHLFFGQKLSIGLFCAILSLIVSAIIAGFNDLAFNSAGYFWGLINCFSTSFYVILMRKMLKTHKINEFTAVFLNNSLGFPFLILLFFMTDNIQHTMQFFSTATNLLLFWIVFIINGISGFGLSLGSWWCVATTSATTYSFVGSLNKVPLTIFGWLLFPASLTPLGIASVFTSISGGFLYSFIKSREKRN